jgi:hypothetical protein
MSPEADAAFQEVLRRIDHLEARIIRLERTVWTLVGALGVVSAVGVILADVLARHLP